MQTIWFKKQMKNQWRRDDGEGPRHVSDEEMTKEVMSLIDQGWSVRPHGSNFLRSIEVVKI